jgi:hypothetical protein
MVLLTNHHSVLTANEATGVLTSLTGLYPDDHGSPISNSFRYFNPNGTTNPADSFTYWTSHLFDPSTLSPTDTSFNVLTAAGNNTPAPWVPYTRARCNVGAVATDNLVLETSADIPLVFGANSPEAAELKANPSLASADFMGIAIHCASGQSLCSAANNGKPGILPDEPGAYSNFMALYGNKYVAPQISPNGPMTDLNGNVIQDSQGNVGFPGADGMTAEVSLSYVAAMQEHGVPITYAEIADAHDNHSTFTAFGPGQAGYVAALKAYDNAFGKFFARLTHDGINQTNTLFVFTADQSDHFVGGAPTPANCDGVTVPCTYSQIGEININLTGLLATEQGITTPFTVHADSAPAIYITGNPARDNQTVTRPFEQALGKLTFANLITGATGVALTRYLADPVGLSLLHMVTSDPARTPTLVMFGDPNAFVFSAAPNCNSPCEIEEPAFAWNHGDISPDIHATWLGLVGPGISAVGTDTQTWSDHADIRPTIMQLLGLQDDYSHAGRALIEDLATSALPASENTGIFVPLAQIYKQINAPLGQLGLAGACISTLALESSSSNDTTYTTLENQLISFTQQRDTLASQISALLEGAAFQGQTIDPQQATQFIAKAQSLLSQIQALATCSPTNASTSTSPASAVAPFSTSNQLVNLTATVTSPGGTVNGGAVTFTITQNGTAIGAAVTSGAVSNGMASANFTLPGGTAPGMYTITASYAPGPGLNGSSGTNTLTVRAVQTVLPPTISKAFASPQIDLFFAPTTLSFTITNPAANAISFTDIAVTDVLPSGLALAVPSGLTPATCGGGLITAPAGGSTITVTGATLAPGTSCIFSVQVVSTAVGTFTNTTGAVNAVGGTVVGNTATAT